LSEIIVHDLRFSYPPLQRSGEPIPVLTSVELQVERGEFLSIMGGTGVGKTTLCLALNGTVPHSTGGRFGGDVVVAGLNTKEHPVALLASQVGVVFQDAESQLFNMTVEDEVAFGLESLGVPRAEMRERVDWALSAVGMVPHRHRSPFHLSGGQKQRVAIAAMLAMLPRILVLDEPTSGLDPVGKAEVFCVISQLSRNRQMTIVLVEQEGEKIAEFSDRVAVLHEGQIALIGSPADVFSRVDLLHEMGVTVPQVSELANLLNRHMGTRHVFTTLDDARQALAYKIAPAGRATRKPLESVGYPREAPVVITGSSAELRQGPVTPDKPNPHALNSQSLCIQVRDLWYRYDGESDALRGTSLDVEEGDFVAIIGQNGSGKTTLVKHFNGLLKPTRGTVQVYGRDTTDLSVGQLARQVGYVFQNPDHQIFSPTVRQEIAFGPQNLGLTGDEVDRRVAEALARFHLAAHADAPPALLGYGLRRKVGVAAVYAMRPRVFILDEPTAGLDWRGVQELMSLLSDMNAEGHTILLVTHDMRIVAEHARRTMVLHEGKVLADGNTRVVFKRTDWLIRAHIEPPQIVQLARQLALSGVGTPTGVLTVEAFCHAYEAHLAGQEGVA
jgi:cobalt transport protein ATP-binding subunit